MSFPRGILPIVSLEEPHTACILADLLLDEHVHQIEVVFRTTRAAEVIQTLTNQFPELLVGAGTIRNAEQLEQAIQAGAAFFVSPAFNHELAANAKALNLDYIPGVATPTEAAAALNAGFYNLKFFPAELLGGPAWIRAVHPVFPESLWFPSGGISVGKAEEYLALSCVPAVGVGEIARLDEIREGKWDLIRQRARHCGRVNGSLPR